MGNVKYAGTNHPPMKNTVDLVPVHVESLKVQISDATYNAATRLRWMPSHVLASPLDRGIDICRNTMKYVRQY